MAFSFGSTTASSSAPLFGQPSQASATFGNFGAPGTATSFGFGAQPAASNAFGQAPAAQTFGQPAGSQPTGGFGFGQPQPAASTGFGFGQTQPSGSSGFGQPQTPALGGFGQPQTPALGGFGQPQSAASSGFGQPPSAASSGFGQSQPAASNSFGFNAAPASSGFGFGAPHSSPAMFGQTQPASTSAPSVPAFGVSPGQSAPGFGFTPTGSSAPSLAPFSGSFGSTTAQSAPQSTPPLFGITPQSAPAFGVASSSGQSTPAVPAFGMSAPAASQAAPAFGLPAASSATPASSQGQFTAASGQSGPSFGSFGFGASSAATTGPAAGAASGTSGSASGTPSFGLSGPASSSAPALSTFQFPSAPSSAPASTSTAGSTLGASLFPQAVSTPLPPTTASTSTPLSFGIETAAASSTPAANPASSAAATAAVSPVQGFNFGSTAAPSAPPPGSSAPAASTSAAASQAGAAAQPAVLNAPSQIKGKNVKSIIDDWNNELNAHSRAFMADAQSLAEWDQHIRRKRRELLEMEAHLNRAASQQDAVSQKLHMLETHQRETHDSLVQMERTAISMYQDEKHLMNDEDSERDKLYARAEKISAELGIITLEFKSCIDSVNSRANSHGEASNPLSKIVHILNNQLQALSNVDDGSEQVTKRLEQLTDDVSMDADPNSHLLRHAPKVMKRSCLQCKQPRKSRVARYTQPTVTVRAEQNQSQSGKGSSSQPRTYQQSWERQSNYDYPPPPSQSSRQPPSGPPPPPDNNNNGFGSDFTKALLAGVFILGIGTGVWFDSQVSLYPSNVASTEIIDRKTPNSEVCMASGYSSMVFDQRIFVSFSPFNVYVAQPEVKPGCVLRRSNVRVLESRKLVSSEEVQSCKRNMNTFAFVGDLEKSPEVSCVYHSEDAENAFLRDPKSARLGDGFRARPGFENVNAEPSAGAAGAAAAKAAS